MAQKMLLRILSAKTVVSKCVECLKKVQIKGRRILKGIKKMKGNLNERRIRIWKKNKKMKERTGKENKKIEGRILSY